MSNLIFAHQMPQGVYKIVPVESRVLDQGDCWGRALIRIEEMEASLTWLEVILALYGKWESPRKAIGSLARKEFALAVVYEGRTGHEQVTVFEVAPHDPSVYAAARLEPSSSSFIWCKCCPLARSGRPVASAARNCPSVSPL